MKTLILILLPFFGFSQTSSYVRFGEPLKVEATNYFTKVNGQNIDVFFDKYKNSFCYIQVNRFKKWRRVYIKEQNFKLKKSYIKTKVVYE